MAGLFGAAAGLRAQSLAEAISHYNKGSYAAALPGFRAAAVRGDATAQFYLGFIYQTGRGVPIDDRMAVFWYEKAAEQGDPAAQTNLGFMYSNGRGVAQDDRMAVFWYAKAAEQGLASAQFNLGLRYADGRGVPKDEQTAYFWWLLSSAQGHGDARHNRDVVERRLTPQQRADAQAAARVWKPWETIPGAIVSPELPTPASSNLSPDSTGTGFRIARDRFITNHHVIEDCRQVRVDGAAAQIGATDIRMDLALLSASVTGPIASVRVNRPLVGEAVTVAGFPLQGLLSGFQVTTGTLSSLSGLGGDTSQFQITAPVQAGNSGGPVLDSAGRVMGVVVAKLNAIRTARVTGDLPQNVNFAIGGNALRSFLDANDVNYQTSLLDRPLPTTSVAQQAQGFTVRVECWK